MRGLVEDVEYAHQAGADLRRQADALRLAAGERASGAIEGEIIQPDVYQEAQPRANLFHQLAHDERLRSVSTMALNHSSASPIDDSVTSVIFLPLMAPPESPASGGARRTPGRA